MNLPTRIKHWKDTMAKAYASILETIGSTPVVRFKSWGGAA